MYYDELPKEGFEECILCGKKTKGTAFCKECWKEHETEELLKILNDYIEDIEEDNNINENNEEYSCIICGNKSGNYLFCKECYKKFKGKTLLFKVNVSNKQKIEIVDDYYDGRYVCKDGHIVKSKSEREIDNYLFDHNIMHAYEKALPVDDNRENDLHPDFFLKDYLGEREHVYIEHWGYNEDDEKYTSQKEYKKELYKKLKITLICTNEKEDMNDIETALDRKLNKDNIKKNKIN